MPGLPRGQDHAPALGTRHGADPKTQPRAIRAAPKLLGEWQPNRERQSRCWTLDQLAEASGVSRRMLVNVEQGAANPSVATLLKITEALGVGLPALVEPPQLKSLRVTHQGEGAALWSGQSGGAESSLQAPSHAPAGSRSPQRPSPGRSRGSRVAGPRDRHRPPLTRGPAGADRLRIPGYGAVWWRSCCTSPSDSGSLEVIVRRCVGGRQGRSSQERATRVDGPAGEARIRQPSDCSKIRRVPLRPTRAVSPQVLEHKVSCRYRCLV